MELGVSEHQVTDGDVIWRCTGSSGEITTDLSFGALLKRLRQQAHLSQHQLAVKIGTTQSAVARLEANAAQPKLATLSKLAAALGEDLQVLVSGRGAQ